MVARRARMSRIKSIKRAVIYGRVSGDDRERDSLSVQLEMGRAHAEKRGYTIIAEFTEDERGVSGAAFNAPALERALSLAEQGEYDVLIVREMDRLARDYIKQHIVEKRLQAAGVEIDYVLYDFPDTPEGYLQKDMLAILAKYDRYKITERMERGKRVAVLRGNVMTAGHPPFGYRETKTDDGHRLLEPLQGVAEWARQIFVWYVYGDESSSRLSLRAVARKLEKHGVLSSGDMGTVPAVKKKPRGSWRPESVRDILKNPVYYGDWTYKTKKGEPLIVKVPPLIDRDTWDAAQKRLKENKMLASRNTRYEYLLRSRLTCGKCGYSFSARKMRGHLYYRCPASHRTDLRHQCDMRMIRVDRLDGRVWLCVASIFSEPEKLRDAYEIASQEAQNQDIALGIASIDAEIEKLDLRMVRLQHIYLDGDLKRSVYLAQRDEIKTELNRLAARREKLEEMECLDQATALETLEEFAAVVHDQILSVEDFNDRVWYIDALDIRATVGADRRVAITAHGYKIGEVDCD